MGGAMKTVAFTTLGCRVNQYDTDAMKGLFLQHDYEAVDLILRLIFTLLIHVLLRIWGRKSLVN